MIRVRMNQFMIDVMRFPEDEVPELRHRLWLQYGTTLRGLQSEFSVDMDAFLEYVHDVPLEEVIHPDPSLDRLLSTLPQQKVIFTNASHAHAQRVIDLLAISGHFDTIIDIYAMAPFCKPEKDAFRKAFSLIDTEPQYCMLIDDSPDNLSTAQVLGMATISIGLRRHDGSPHIEHITQLAQFFQG